MNVLIRRDSISQHSERHSLISEFCEIFNTARASLRRGWSSAARLLGLRVRIPPWAWMSVCCESCVLSSRGLCVGLITRPEQSYRVWCVWVWSWSLCNEWSWPIGSLLPTRYLQPSQIVTASVGFQRSHIDTTRTSNYPESAQSPTACSEIQPMVW